MKKVKRVLVIVGLAGIMLGYSPSTWWCDGGYFGTNRAQARQCMNWGGHWNPST